MTDVFEPVSASRHVAQQQMRAEHGWFALFVASIKGAVRGRG